ncbi:hypothetical protein V9T40_011533 [Parthenolecanium corni]|uniref:Myotubularin phosphatase domain-containing protein n=1 Tax=Parthenolecanium corni TaxID=536013 RepID=A0AAN9TIW9_9HEMI
MKVSRMSFKSYVDLDESDQKLNSSADESFCEQLTPKILPGEMLIAEAQSVLLFTPTTSQKTGKSGVLTVTNFRLSFVTSEEKPAEELCYQENLLLGEYDICLSNVDTLYLLSGDKKRRLLPGQRVPERVKVLFVLCKNMKVLTFSFKFSPVGHGKTLTNALLHHAFPRRHQLLFAYDYREPYFKYNQKVISFRDPEEWRKEMERTGCKGWRLTYQNQRFQLSSSLPEFFVVGKEVTDSQINIAAQHFRCNRPPLWCWSTKSGAALVRMADIVSTVPDRKQENAMLESVRKSHPRKTPPSVIDLAKDLPLPKDLSLSYFRLRELCVPDSSRQFWVQDNHFFTLLENCKWLLYVSTCLIKSAEAADLLHKDVSVVLQETDGRDMCCVISSLTVLLLDPYFRTLNGFQSLIQKEWVIMGHPFCTRLRHIYTNEEENQQSPIFLLFLDCVWQLLQQFPTQFQFSETYLTTLWDATHISLFDTFLFDCERDRIFAVKDPNNPLILRNVWDWGEMYPDKDIELFYNPFYNRPENFELSAPLDVQPNVSDMQLWSQCYFRFVPLLELIGGGKPMIDLAARAALSIENGSFDIVAFSKHIGSFYPFTHWRTNTKVPPLLINSSLNLSNIDTLLDTQSVITVTDF